MKLIKELQELLNSSEYNNEHNLQVEVIRFLKKNYPDFIFFAVPNGGTRNKLEAGRLKAEGVISGISDLIILGKKPRAYFVELKSKTAKWSETQKKFKADLEALGWNYYLIRKIN